MKAKEYIIQKLVNIGKKHRWMKYPMLALVSLISLFFLIIEKCMERPKRAVIALVCFVLIVSQSWYLISIASDPNESVATGNSVSNENSLNGVSEEENLLGVNVNSVGASSNENPTYTIYFKGMAHGTSDFSISIEDADFPEGGYALPEQSGLPTDAGTVTDSCYKLAGWAATTEDAASGNTISGKYQKSDFGTNKNITVYAYWQVQAYEVTYAPDFNPVTEDGEAGVSNVVSVPIVGGTAPQIIPGDQGYIRNGYSFDTWNVEVDGRIVNECPATGWTITGITDPHITLKPKWIPHTYTISFAGGDTDVTGSMESVSATYGTAGELPLNQFSKIGYTFAGWLGEDGEHYNDGASVLNLTAVDRDDFTMTAQWRYQSAIASKTNLSFEYSDSVNESINLYHSTEGDGQFEPTLIGVSGETVKGTVTKDNFEPLTGIHVGVAENEITLSAAAVDTVTLENSPITLTFNIHDKQHDVTDTSISIVIQLNKKELSVTGVRYKEKEYDGTAEFPIGSIWYTDGIRVNDATKTEITGITVNNDGQIGTFIDAKAGNNKTFTVNNIYISGENKDYYTIPSSATFTGENGGTIKKVTVDVTPVLDKTGDSWIYTGETPRFTVEVDAEDVPELVRERDVAEIIKTMKDNQGAFTTGDYSLSSYSFDAEHTYPVGIDKTKVSLENYDLSVTPGTLLVKHPAVQDADYRITGDQLEGSDWYYNKGYINVSDAEPVISAVGTQFNKIRITNNPEDKAKTYEASMFSDTVSVSEAMATTSSQKLYIQMANTSGAVTALKEVSVRVDVTAPVIDSANITLVTPDNNDAKGLIRFLKFGNFFNQKLKITVPVTDALSGADTLTYYLGSDTSATSTGELKIKNGTATFEISPNYKGEILLIAKDVAGNKQSLKLQIDGSATLWVIEDTAPDVSVTPTDNNGNTAFFGEDTFYKSVSVDVQVTDVDAGVSHIIWNIKCNGELIEENTIQALPEEYSETLKEEYVFNRKFTESGAYEIALIAYDNAGNASEEETVSFVVDGTAPEITVTPEDYDEYWSESKEITFTVTDTESGVDLLTLKNKDGATLTFDAVEGMEDTYTFTVTEKGIYTIKAIDRAGNFVSLPLEFTKVSSEIPDNPVVTIEPEIPEDVEDISTYWFAENPTITITEPATTPDGTAIVTYYHIWEEGTTEPTYDNKRAVAPFQLPGEGIWNLRVWAETESGKQNVYESEEDGLYQIRYDCTAPLISDIVITGNGTKSQINFKITEVDSGLTKLEAIYNDNEESAQTLLFEYKGNGTYTASFTASMKGSYTIKATDVAGNIGWADAFEPMNIVVTGITGNADKGITVVGQVTAGTFDVSTITVKYGKEGEELSINADDLLVTTDSDGNKSFTAKLTQLAEDTRYRFMITALTVDGESCDYTGAFKTGIADAVGVNVVGTVIDETLAADDTSLISVMLYENDAVIQSRNVKSGGSFIFTSVPDGLYTIRATNGNRTAIQGVAISNNTIIEPTSNIQLVLRDGQATDVIYEDTSIPQFTISGLENLFNDTTNFGSAQDLAVIQAGGMVEFCMKVNGLSEEEVSENDLSKIQYNMTKNETVAMYLDLSIWKRATGAYGLISESQVTSIAGGKTVRVVIPLSVDLASKQGLSVIRVHDGNVERLVDVDTNPNTYTFESALFSTYALVYIDDAKTTSTDAPTTGSDNNSTTDNNSTATTGTEQNGNNNTGQPGGSTSDISKQPNTNQTVGQSGSSSPKTGDGTPIILIGIVMVMASLAGLGLLKNKKRQ